MRWTIRLLLCLLAMPAAAATPFTILYHPRSIVELRGQVQVAPFAYVPANPKWKPNQIPNTAIGNIYLNTSIGEFVADGVRQELRTSGVSLQPGGRCRIGGTINAIRIDDLGLDSDFSLSIRYVLTGAGDSTLYETEENTAFMASKFGGAAESISLLFAKNINALLASPDFAKAFESGCPREG